MDQAGKGPLPLHYSSLLSRQRNAMPFHYDVVLIIHTFSNYTLIIHTFSNYTLIMHTFSNYALIIHLFLNKIECFMNRSLFL
jgi:hypothetical protein